MNLGSPLHSPCQLCNFNLLYYYFFGIVILGSSTEFVRFDVFDRFLAGWDLFDLGFTGLPIFSIFCRLLSDMVQLELLELHWSVG